MEQQTQPTTQRFWDDKPVRTTRRGHFWITAERVTLETGAYQRGPMFVEWEAPEQVTQPYPVVLVHGGTLQGIEWGDTPDGSVANADMQRNLQQQNSSSPEG